MPTKRARHKKPLYDRKKERKLDFLAQALDDLVLVFKKKGGFKKPKKKIPLSKSQYREINDVQVQIEYQIRKIPKKKMPKQSNPNYWTILVEYISKEHIAKAIKYRSRWKEGLRKAMVAKHEGRMYKKKY